MKLKNLLLGIFLSAWLGLVTVSFVSEVSTQWAPVAQKCATQTHWIQDCKNPKHWEKYTEECAFHTSKHYPSFWVQYPDAVLRNVKWCGVDKCEFLLIVKGISLSLIVTVLLRAGPVAAAKGWHKLNNE